MEEKLEIAACQVFVGADDYASEEHFESMLDRVGQALSEKRTRAGGQFLYPCLAVFPEMIGTFLPLAGRLSSVRHEKTTDAALTKVALRMLPQVVTNMLRGKILSTNIGFLLAVAPEVRRIYRSAFSRFARKYEVWTVAGSALLPKNAYGDTATPFSPADGRIYNTSYTFDPTGRHVGATRKVNLVPTVEDKLGLSPGRRGELSPVFAPFGGIGTLICYDGFAVAHTPREPRFCALLDHYDAQACKVIAHPAANFWPWETPWTFEGAGGSMLRRQQWLDEGLFSQMQRAPREHVRYGVTAQLLGRIFDNYFDGTSQLIERTQEGARVLAQAARGDADSASEEVLLRLVRI